MLGCSAGMAAGWALVLSSGDAVGFKFGEEPNVVLVPSTGDIAGFEVGLSSGDVDDHPCDS